MDSTSSKKQTKMSGDIRFGLPTSASRFFKSVRKASGSSTDSTTSQSTNTQRADKSLLNDLLVHPLTTELLKDYAAAKLSGESVTFLVALVDVEKCEGDNVGAKMLHKLYRSIYLTYIKRNSPSEVRAENATMERVECEAAASPSRCASNIS